MRTPLRARTTYAGERIDPRLTVRVPHQPHRLTEHTSTSLLRAS